MIRFVFRFFHISWQFEYYGFSIKKVFLLYSESELREKFKDT